jgi:hypothetical protein
MSRKALATLVVSTFLFTLPAVAAAQTRVDVDRHTDFRQYKTFAVDVGRIVRSDGVVDEGNTLAENRLRQAVTREFEARGLEPSDAGADLVIRVSNRETERTTIVSSGFSHSPWGFRRRWGYWGYPGWGPYGGDVWTRRFIESSVILDVVDGDTGDLVYRAQVTDEVGSNPDKHIAKAVDKALKKFPVKESVTN